MQPAASIPPYHEKTLPNLIGLKVRVPKVKNPARNWMMEIKAVRFVTPNSAAVWVLPISPRGGKGGKWVDITSIRFKTQITDPLVMAIHKAQEKVE